MMSKKTKEALHQYDQKFHKINKKCPRPPCEESKLRLSMFRILILSDESIRRVHSHSI